ncbi:helix-turn-helix domain-containing protein [Veillonella montpellierensis]|uniref:helix-turn-helix domain-containing protein n=1 Tax=Veillonella montpellierensis TaxID=187328 RepID=UPI0023F64C64|nr:helix-turn-helix transcriptional regulator [Veillonella montpellierensis]
MSERIHERIKRLRKEHQLSVEDIIVKLGISRATYYRYENQDVEKLPITILKPLANIFNTTPEYLMGWSSDQSTKKNSNAHTSTNMPINSKDERDIQKRLQSILDDLNSDAALSFYNGDQEMDDETKELLKVSLEQSIRTAKIRAKEKFTPNKYKNK